MYVCRVCEGLFLNQYTSAEELIPYYPPSYYAFQNKSDEGIYRRLKFLNSLIYWNAIWNRLNVKNVKHGWGRSTFLIVKGKLLDIGCGEGNFLRFLKKKNPRLQLFGCDAFAPDAKNIGFDYVRQDFKEAEYASDSFDYIAINHVLEHLSEKRKNLDQRM